MSRLSNGLFFALLIMAAVFLQPLTGSPPAFAVSTVSKEKISVVILFKHHNPTLHASMMKFHHGNITRTYNIIQGYAANLTADEIATLRNDPEVASIDPNVKFHAFDSSADAQIRATQVQNSGNTGQGVSVAILDTGIDNADGEFTGRIIQCHNEITLTNTCADDNGHGTHVAGIVGAAGVNPSAKGVAPGVSFLIDKVLDSAGNGDLDNIIAGIDWAVQNHAKAISMSLGVFPNDNLPNCDNDYPTLTAAVNTAVAAGVTVVAASGNTDGVLLPPVAAPACISSAIAVSAVDNTDHIASFSSTGAAMANHGVSAPGVGIFSTVPMGTCDHCDPTGYTTLDGTSMATPHVTGVIALMLHKSSGLSPRSIRNILFNDTCTGSTNPSCPTGTVPNTSYGYGRVDALRSIGVFNSSLSSSLTISDSVTRKAALHKSFSDSLTMSDSLTRKASLHKSFSDFLTISDSVTRIASPHKSFSDSLTISDSVTRITSLHKSFSDSLTISDSVTRITSLNKLLHESLTISDSVTAIKLALSVHSGTVGSKTILTGTGFVQGSTVSITYDGKIISTIFPYVGTLNQQITIPVSTTGQHVIRAVTLSPQAAGSITFTVSPLISLNKNNGPVGTGITVTGNGFASRSSVTIKYDSTDVTPRGLVTDTSGYFYGTITVPSSLSASHNIIATDASSNTNSQPFAAIPSISLNVTSGLVGNHVAVRGSNFVPSSNVVISYDSTTVATATADGTGTINGVTFTVPLPARGAHPVIAKDSFGNANSVVFSILSPIITLNPTSGHSGGTVLVTGSNFIPNSLVTITYDGTTVKTVTATATGTIPSGTTFTVPLSTYGYHPVISTDSSGNTNSVSFLVAKPVIVLSPTSGHSGGTVLVTGSNFIPNSLVTITYDGTTVKTVTATATGAIPNKTTFTVPASAIGLHTISATDSSSNNVVAIFTRN